MTTVFSNGKVLLADHRRSVYVTNRERHRHRTSPTEGKYSNDQVEKIVVPTALAHKGSKILAFAGAGDVRLISLVREFLCETPDDMIDNAKKSTQIKEANISLMGVISRVKSLHAMGDRSCSILLIDDLERTHLLFVEPDRVMGGERTLMVRHQVGNPGQEFGIGSGFQKYNSIVSYLKSKPSYEDKLMMALHLDPASSPEFSAFIGKSKVHYKHVRHGHAKKEEKLTSIFSPIPSIMMMMEFGSAPTVNFSSPSFTTNKL